MKATALSIPRGSLLVLVDVPLEDDEIGRFADMIAEAAGHTEFAILRVGDDPVTVLSIEEVMSMLSKCLEAT